MAETGSVEELIRKFKGHLQFFYFVASSRESRGLRTSGINPRKIKSFVFA